MPTPPHHKWQFRARFRRHAFGWKSRPAIQRIKEAVSEIKKVARKDQLLAAEGAVLFLEKISPAIERVDSSSGTIGTAVDNAVVALVAIIAKAPADDDTRERWLARLWAACQDDEIPYLEGLGDFWGELCGSETVASRWADELLGTCRLAWSPDPDLRGYFKGTTHCLSSLLAAERFDELLALLDLSPVRMWHDRQYGVKALAAQGKTAEAIRYAEESRGLNDSPVAIARACEEALLAAGHAEEAYEHYGLVANRSVTHDAWFRAVARRYPHRNAADILADLVAGTPGEEGKWFAAAKNAGLYDQAIALANSTPCSPQTLTRAARDFATERPAFAVAAGLAALRWLVAGFGYEVTSLDVANAYTHTMEAAGNAGCAEQTRSSVRDLVARESGDRFVARALARHLGSA